MNYSKNYFSKDYFFGHKNSNYRDYYMMDQDRYWESIISAIKDYGIHGRIMDIGCVFGFLLKRAKPYFTELYGLDISDFAIDEAKKQVPLAKLQILDIEKEKLPYPDNFFDLITAIDVLEHTNSIKGLLGKIVPKMKNEGYLIITVPLRDTWAGKLWHLLLDKDKSHVSVPSRKEIFDAVDCVGLEIIKKNYFYNTAYFRLKGIPISMELVLKINDKARKKY
jgi:SAM-dependent methyltransferase